MSKKLIPEHLIVLYGFVATASKMPAMIAYKYFYNYEMLREATHSKNYLLKEVTGNFAGLGVLAFARTVKGIPLSIGTPPNSPLMSKT